MCKKAGADLVRTITSFMFEADLVAKVVHLQNSYNHIPCNDLPLGQSQTYPGKYWKGKYISVTVKSFLLFRLFESVFLELFCVFL